MSLRHNALILLSLLIVTLGSFVHLYSQTVSAQSPMFDTNLTDNQRRQRGSQLSGQDKRRAQLLDTLITQCSLARMGSVAEIEADSSRRHMLDAANKSLADQQSAVSQPANVEGIPNMGSLSIQYYKKGFGVSNDGKGQLVENVYRFSASSSGAQDCAGKIDEFSASSRSLANVISGGDGNVEGGVDPDAEDEEEEDNSCQVDGGLGWMICPVVELLGNLSDGAFDLVQEHLSIDKRLMESNPNSDGTFVAWRSFRDIANIGFVIVFLIIVFSQVTSLGISSYGIKKILPRLIVGAVLVNLSFLICQIAVDLSEILGSSLKSFLGSIGTRAGEETTSVAGWADVLPVILAGAAFGGALVALAFSGPVLAAAAIALLMTVVILIGRQAGVVILTAISPLAFVAYLLPNTESLFKKWQKMFMGLLLVYPAVALLFGGGGLASRILMSAAEGSGDGDMSMRIAALGAASIPLIMLPTLLRGSMNAMGSIGTKLSGIAGSANARVGRGIKSNVDRSRLGDMRREFQRKSDNRRARRRANSSLDRSRVGQWLGLSRGQAGAIAEVSRAESEAVDNAVVAMQKQDGWTTGNTVQKAQGELESAIARNDTTKARAAAKILLSKGKAGEKALQDGISDSVTESNISSDAVEYLRSDLSGAGLKPKNAALHYWAVQDGFSTPKQLLDEGEIGAKLTNTQLAGQSEEDMIKLGMHQQRATEMMYDEKIWNQLNEGQKSVVSYAAAGGDTKDLLHAQGTTDANGNNIGGTMISSQALQAKAATGPTALSAAQSKTLTSELANTIIKDDSLFKPMSQDQQIVVELKAAGGNPANHIQADNTIDVKAVQGAVVNELFTQIQDLKGNPQSFVDSKTGSFDRSAMRQEIERLKGTSPPPGGNP